VVVEEQDQEQDRGAEAEIGPTGPELAEPDDGQPRKHEDQDEADGRKADGGKPLALLAMPRVPGDVEDERERCRRRADESEQPRREPGDIDEPGWRMWVGRAAGRGHAYDHEADEASIDQQRQGEPCAIEHELAEGELDIAGPARILGTRFEDAREIIPE